MLAACTHYAPAPPHPEQFSPAFDARRLDALPAGETWSGAALLEAALQHNHQVAEARAKLATALAAVRSARQPAGATLTLTGEYANETPRWGYGAAAEIPLELGVRRSGRVTVAELQALQARYDLWEAMWTVRSELERARVAVATAEQEVPLAERAAGLRHVRLERLERRVTGGEDARAVALLAQTDLAAADRRVAEARSRLQQGDLGLARALGVPPEAVRDVSVAPPQSPPALDELPAWRRDAAVARRDVLRAVADYDLAENALRLEVARQYPEVRLGPGYNYDHGIAKLPFNLVLVLPPFDLNRSPIAQAEAGRASAGRSLELAQANALAGVDKAAQALSAANLAAERTRTQDLAVARRSTALAARALRAGEGDRVDELAAQAAETDAELGAADAARAAAEAVVDLEDALRRPFDPAEAAVLAKAAAWGDSP